MSQHIVVDRVTKQFDVADDRTLALDNVSVTIEQNEFVSIVGRSGCGKTTLLNMIAGLITPTEGTVRIDDKVITRPGPDRGMVFQLGVHGIDLLRYLFGEIESVHAFTVLMRPE